MNLFFDAFVFTFGIIAAVAVPVLLYKGAKFSWRLHKAVKHAKLVKEANLAYRTRQDAAKVQRDQQLQVFIDENPEVQSLVEALRATPYSEGDKLQNKKRSKIQTKLRKLVPSQDIRDGIYEMAR